MKRLPIIMMALVAVTAVAATGCEEQTPEEKAASAAKKYLKKDCMDTYYYWSDKVPQNLDPEQYDIFDYFDALLYEKDRWSWMMDRKGYLEMTTGEVSGSNGMSIVQPLEYYGDYRIVVRYVFKDSPAWREGVRRGWIITHIGGQTTNDLVVQDKFYEYYNASPQTFTFLTPDGQTVDKSITTAMVNESSVLMEHIYTAEEFPGLTEPVGYFNYRSFMGSKISEITSAIDKFKDKGVRKVILDLRYNGGGDGNASSTLVNCLAPASAEGEPYAVRSHNELLRKNGYDTEVTCERTEHSLDLDLLMVITGPGTASASEVVLNGLKPLMNVKHVGDTTYGKPNGMYVLLYPGSDEAYEKYNKGDYTDLEYCFLPICFYTDNKLGEGHYENGIAPEHYRPDDVYHDFGVEEDNLNACLTYIATGKFPPLPGGGRSSRTVTTRASDRAEIALEPEKRDPHYGKYLIRAPF